MNEPILITGIHLTLTEALHSIVREKMLKLFQHEPSIVRVRVELAQDVHKKDKEEFFARGYIEVQGPNMMVTTYSDNLYNAIDDLENKLLRKLRNRSRLQKTKRKLCAKAN